MLCLGRGWPALRGQGGGLRELILMPGRYCGATASGRQLQPLPLAIYMSRRGLGCGR